MPSQRAAATSRRGPTPAVYRRRRLAVLVLGILVVVFALLAIRSCGGDGEGPLDLTAEEAHRVELDARPVELTLSFSGDLLIHSPIYLKALELGGGQTYDFAPLFERIRPYVADADLAFCHVEVPMTSAEPSSYPIFNTPPSLAKAIAATGWDACDTASNHTLDQQEDGIGETIKALEDAGVKHTGSATSERESEKPLILEAEGVKIAYLAYTTDTNGIPPPHPYSVNVLEGPEQVIDDARRARKAGADAVIVQIHWASELVPEYVSEPAPGQEELVKKLSQEPAITAIVGQGPHVVQPVAEANGKPVLFAEGNLISNQGAVVGLAAGSQDGYIALLDLRIDGGGAEVTRIRYVPVWVDHADYQVLPVGPALEAGEGDPVSLRDSYERTVGVVGRDPAQPVPAKLP